MKLPPCSNVGILAILLMAAAPALADEPAKAAAPAPATASSPAEKKSTAEAPAKDAKATAAPAKTAPAAAPAASAAATAPAPAAAAAPATATPATATAPAAAAAATATAPAAAPKPPPPPPPPPPAVTAYDEATTLFGKKKYDDSWKELDAVANLEGFTPELGNKVRVLRAQILMWRKKPDPEQAKALVLRVLHEDKEGKLFAASIPLVQSMADDLRQNHPFVFHEPLPYSRPGRPLKLIAKVAQTGDAIESVKLHFRGQGGTEYSEQPMKLGPLGWTFTLREPESLAPAGVTDEYSVEYYFTGEDASGKVLDMDGSPAEPLLTTLSSAKVVEAEKAAGVDLNAVVKAENAPPVLPPPPPPETPWYLQWYTLTAGGVVVVGVVTTVVLVATRPHAALPADRLGTITFPVTR